MDNNKLDIFYRFFYPLFDILDSDWYIVGSLITLIIHDGRVVWKDDSVDVCYDQVRCQIVQSSCRRDIQTHDAIPPDSAIEGYQQKELVVIGSGGLRLG